MYRELEKSRIGSECRRPNYTAAPTCPSPPKTMVKRKATWLATLLLAATALLATLGCESKTPPPERSPAESADPPEDPDRVEESEELATAFVDAPEGWKQLDPQQLSDQDQAMLERAQEAQKALGSTLMRELTEAVSKDSYAEAVEVCNVRAPQIAESVRDEQQVAIGRTSFDLRNPDNEPPTWAEPYVDKRVPEASVLRSDDQLAYLLPIRLGEMCTGCHGPADSLAEGVPERLAEMYPDDEATGFQAGDLRGWFWVEVPES